MLKQCRALFCPSARMSPPADRPRKGLKHPLRRSNIAGAVGIASLSWPCMYLGFLAMYRGMKSIKPYNAKILFPAHPLKCTCWCQSRVQQLFGADGVVPVEAVKAFGPGRVPAFERGFKAAHVHRRPFAANTFHPISW